MATLLNFFSKALSTFISVCKITALVLLGILVTFCIYKIIRWLDPCVRRGYAAILELRRARCREDQQRQIYQERQRLLPDHVRQTAEERIAAQARQHRQVEERERELNAKQTEELAQKQKERDTLRACYEQWQAGADKCFANVATTRSFPEPRIDACRKCGDNRRSNGVKYQLRMCQHSLKQLLLASGAGISRERLTKERLKWHPDRFSKVMEVVREEMTDKSKETFQFFGMLLEEYDA